MARGGMCKSPFAGNPSMNQLDDEFMAALFKGELSVDQTLALRIIKMSVRDYLYFGLGKNGITPEKFIEAYLYLFKVRSQDPMTWGICSVKERFRGEDGATVKRRRDLKQNEIQAKCFDTHYSLSALGDMIPMTSFLAKLKKKRETVVNANLKQITAYMRSYRTEEWKRLPTTKRRGKYSFPGVDPIPVLIAPEDCKALAQLYLFGRRLKVAKAAVNPVPRKALSYKCLLF